MATPIPITPLDLAIPDSFKTSYHNYLFYPTNLILQYKYPAALHASRKRLDSHSLQLFSERPSHVVFRDYTGAGANSAFEKRILKDEESLQIWLGVRSSPRPMEVSAAKRDPKCRYIFIGVNHSRSPLEITRAMLASICTFHQVMPAYIDFLTVFGSQKKLRFAGFREQVLLTHPNLGLAIEALGRSGQQFQLCYNLKAVSCKIGRRLLEDEWSIRQAAVYHQFDAVYGTTVWIITQVQNEVQEIIEDATARGIRSKDEAFANAEEGFRTSLRIHLNLCHWASEEWRWYLESLEDAIWTRHTSRMTRNESAEHLYATADIQAAQHAEYKVNTAIVVMEANVEILQSLRNFYKRLLDNPHFDLRTACEDDILIFASEIDDLICELRLQVTRAKLHAKSVVDTKSLILRQLQTQAANLTIKMARMTQKEAIAMRIVTVVTLIYLPATFVSTFFGTDIVKYQNPNRDSVVVTDENSQPYKGSFSLVALERWLQLTLPLTFLTGFVSWWAFKRSGLKIDTQFGDGIA